MRAGCAAGCAFGRVAAEAEKGTIETAHRSRETLKEMGFILFSFLFRIILGITKRPVTRRHGAAEEARNGGMVDPFRR
ncbi:hypothetical protein GCM10023157_12710 [Gluconacetobacter asukensis]